MAIGAFILTPTIDYIGRIFSVLVDYLEIRQKLGGKRAESIKEMEDKIEINCTFENNNINFFVAKEAWELYTKDQLLNVVSQKNIETLENDEEINGVEIKEAKAKRPLISLQRKNFPKLRSPNKYLDKEIKEEFEDATLFIKKPDLLPKNIVK